MEAVRAFGGAVPMAKILLVEDNEMNRDMLSRRLGKRGFEVVTAVDGAQAVEQARAEQPQLILMDLSLPVMDGWAATRLRRLRHQARGVATPAVEDRSAAGRPVTAADRDATSDGGRRASAAPLEETSGLHLWMRLYEPLLLVSGPAAFTMYWVWGAPAALFAGCSIALLVFPFGILGHRQLNAGRTEAGILSISVSLWILSATVALVGDMFYAVSLLISVGGIIIAVPYTMRRSVRRAIVCSMLTGSLATWVFLTEPVLSYAPVPEPALRALSGIYALTILALYALIAWDATVRLQRSMETMRSANRALMDSERQLERKVEERTADLTRSERELALARDEALAANRAKSVFLANMSHELRTPLNAVIGYSEMLQEDATDAGHEEYVPDLDRILESGRHLLSLINDVLDLSKIEADRIELFAEDLDPTQLLHAVAHTITPAMEKNGNALEVVVAEDVGTMHTDATRLRQVLLNLLSNAAKFTSAGTVRLGAERRVADGEEVVAFSVRDTGIGMTEEQLEHVFEAFSQAEATTTRDYGGTGLGLTITKRFCQMLGGDVAVTSEPGVGTEFLVTVPATLPEVVAPVVGAQSVEDRNPGSVATGPRARVLVVDDDPVARDLLERQLDDALYEVRTAAGGVEGLRLAREWSPEVILLDVLMPEMDGWTVLSRLKSDPDVASIPVILVSMLDEGNLGYMLGAAEYVHKPVRREELTRLLRRYVGSDARTQVLVVDDEPMTRELLRRSIDALDVEIVEAGDGREALARLELGTPAVILLDLSMPVMDGFAFLRELRAHREWRSLPVVVVTSKDLTREEWKRLDETAEAVLRKGEYGVEELVGTVRALVEGREASGAADP
jgi:signal transduction histidine kinase/CheY-like chemotaxis protein